MSIGIIVLAAISGLSVGIVLTLVVKSFFDQKLKRNAELEASRITQKAMSEAARIEKDSKNRAKEFEKRARRNVETEIKREKEKITNLENSFKNKQKDLDKERNRLTQNFEDKERALKGREEVVKVAESKLQGAQERLEQKIAEVTDKLTQVASYSKDQAKRELMEMMENEAKLEFSKDLVRLEDDTRDKAERKAKQIISIAIARYAGEYSAQNTTSVLALPSEDMKGKVIGKEGRNIRAFEALCGVDLILDEVPDSVVISGFDPVRREVARRTLESLFQDGRIHPSSIEETVNKTKKQLFKSIREDGEKACDELGITGMHPKVLDLVGSLKYRTSYTQNNYSHSIEVGFIAGLIAQQMNEDVMAARRAGLLHDIGKALDHSVEGSHAVIGADFAKKYGEKENICHAIRSHHEDEKPTTALAFIVTAADAISGARPGARKATQDAYIKRLEDLESIANSFDGVTRTFAMQAGREIRVLVDSSKVTDEQSLMLSRDIAKKIEKEMSFPGQIKVTVLRETRAIEHAR
ncbi:MAG: ribonuclease Y [Bdellovibrionaceae bacterium]|nr:ribonuclease Y [Pseudobdellovibrionaceae bacterium]